MKTMYALLLGLCAVSLQALVVPASKFSFRNDTQGVVTIEKVDMRTGTVTTSTLQPRASRGGTLQGKSVRILYPDGTRSENYQEGAFVVVQDGDDYSIEYNDAD